MAAATQGCLEAVAKLPLVLAAVAEAFLLATACVAQTMEELGALAFALFCCQQAEALMVALVVT